MAALDPISALEYNNIRQSIAARVGNFTVWTQHGIPTSTTTSGYGRSFVSAVVTGGSTVGVSDTATEEDMFQLWLDIQAAHVHCFGSTNGTILPTRFQGQTTYPDPTITGRDIIEFAHITDMTTMANAVLAFNHATTDFDSASFDTDFLRTSGGVSVTSTRSTSWGTGANTIINHRVTVNFGTHNNFLYFLFAGGELRFDASLTGGTSGTANTKDWDWARILSAMGTIRIGYVNGNWRTESLSGSGTGSLLSTISTGTTPTTVIYYKQGGGVTGGTPGAVPVTQIYDDNFYRIKASTNTAFSTATQLIFDIEFDDGDAGTGGQVESYLPGRIDEQVTGIVTSNVYTYTPASDFAYSGTIYDAIKQIPPTGTINSSL